MSAEGSFFDVVVVGGGHAGCEAASAAARMGAKTCLVTLDTGTVGALSCNPAIGGIGKGQLTREIDALGGLQARITDQAAVHYRMLNTSKGEAVQSLRAQVDKDIYARSMQKRLVATPGLTLVAGSVEDLQVSGGRVEAVLLADGSRITAARVILTNGTFLRALMHTGESTAEGGRIGEGAVTGLSVALERLGFESGRLKTGTPPRLDFESIDLSRTTIQHPDQEPDGFSAFLPPPRRDWMVCWITRTNDATHEVIRKNLHRSPMYSGVIEGIGPRYCPSIEDKVVRFPNRDGHTVHLEREGIDSRSVYVNGISTSLPADAQEELVRQIPGLEKARFLRHGYAVEYDFFPPHQIRKTFESRAVNGLYLAGQICGTSGYEEAAAQGFLAGVNAALNLADGPPFILRRDEAYMGVLADDLVRCDPREPYRMFTSRAEYRLMLRHDNADLRLHDHARSLGLLTEAELERVLQEKEKVQSTLETLRRIRIGGKDLLSILRRPGATFDEVEAASPEVAGLSLDERIRERVRVDARYETYIERQLEEVRRLKDLEEWCFADGFDFDKVPGLRGEAREKLVRLRPLTLGDARRIAGVSPADLSLLMVFLSGEKHRRKELG
ncbi:MAG TPA: tRNA uridine-5-carboxymethylaminomethyl(34) synthesis enzyme MnmG [Planctomycetes bacterium]|nr:tRNA uridine-5-carboxymethylaminomethyl(34) synthesis enzyme MnmG [Planctomycetota bacterium]HIN81072.1 tRNA uridine-5-carboxymethylaminomethyl(34) synthesis enzyme MnmG [Planctomycetota bacterium]